MELCNCSRCGRLFVRRSDSRQCDMCSLKDEEKLHQVKNYLHHRPGSSLHMVIQETGVEFKLIHRWVSEGRLSLR